MSRIISVITQKGGVGKTTTINALASVFNKQRARVLVIDMDPQGNLSFSTGAEFETVPTIYQVLRGDTKAKNTIQRRPMTDIIPANILLSGIDLEFPGKNREFLLRNALKQIEMLYDYILIDSPPNLNVLTVNALAASKYVILPMLPDIFSLQGIALIYETIAHVRKTCNPDLEIAGILINRYSRRSRLHKEVYGTAELASERLGIPMFQTVIRNCTAISEVQSLQFDITEYARCAGIVKDYTSLAEELIARCNG